LSTARVIKFLQGLIYIGKWLDKDFERATKKDIQNLLGEIERKNYSEWTKHDFKVIIKKFWRWMKDKDDYPEEVKWIKTTVKNNNHKLPEDLLSEEEVKKMVESCNNFRDRALISFLYESGCRAGELLSLQIKHIQFDGIGASAIFPKGKTGARRVRLISSAPHLKLWIENHPKKNNPNAPLWVGLGTVGRNKPLNYPSVRKLLRDVGERAGVKKRINPHNFRHSRATYLASHLTEAQMKEYLGWVQGSEMASIYVHLSGRDTDKAIEEKVYGIKKGEEEEKESC
jgi:integrase